MRARLEAVMSLWILAGVAMLAFAAGAFASSGRVSTAGPPLGQSAATPATESRADAPAGPFAIGGTVLGYDGAPVASAFVDWGWYDPNAPVWFGPTVIYHAGESTTTGADGTFSFLGVTSSPGNDALSAFAPSQGYLLSSWTNDFSTQPSHSLRPGRVPIMIEGLPEDAQIGVTVGDAATGSATTWPAFTGWNDVVAAVPPGFDTVAVELLDDWGPRAMLDWTSPGGTLVPVTPGATAEQEIVLDWAEARRGYVAGTRWQHSARPGDVVTFVLRGWPTGYQASFFGESYGGTDEGTDTRWYGTTYTSAGSDRVGRVSLRVPRGIPLDDLYTLAAYRSDAPGTYLWFQDAVQPCRFSASQTVIRAGEAIRLRGFVLGDDRRVELFERHAPAGKPSFVAARGWKKVATFSASRDGTFRSAWRRPSRTTWYVARIRGYYFPVYTPVVKVAVR